MASKTIFSALSNDKRKSYEALKNCLLLVMQKIAGIRIGLLPQLQQSAGIWDAASCFYHRYLYSGGFGLCNYQKIMYFYH